MVDFHWIHIERSVLIQWLGSWAISNVTRYTHTYIDLVVGIVLKRSENEMIGKLFGKNTITSIKQKNKNKNRYIPNSARICPFKILDKRGKKKGF